MKSRALSLLSFFSRFGMVMAFAGLCVRVFQSGVLDDPTAEWRSYVEEGLLALWIMAYALIEILRKQEP